MGGGDMDMIMTQSTDTQKKSKDKIFSLSLYLSSILRIVEVRSAAIFLSAQAQFRSQLPAD
jgi:hypothetical protein